MATFPRMGYPATFGWQRAPDLDIPNGDAWELPNGEYRYAPKGRAFCVVRFADGRTEIKLMRTKNATKFHGI